MSQSTRERLVNSAVKVFSQKGFFNTKVSDIVSDAGVAQGTFYIYFSSKEEIFLHIVKTIVSQIEFVINSYSQATENPVAEIKEFGNEIFKILYQYREIARIFFFQVICVNDQFKEIYFRTSEKIKQFYQSKLEGLEEPEIKAEMLVGYGKRLVEFDVLTENRSFEHTVSKFEKSVDMLTGEIK
ncbi:TetR/AcrR family transcriptional regulator [Persephonella sp.]